MRGSSGYGWKKSGRSRALDSSAVSETPILGFMRGREVLFPSKDNLKIYEGLSRAHDAEVGAGTSLRNWLDKAERKINEFECLHIFKQIVEFVSISHSKGFVLHNVRPSCFRISSSNYVSFIGPASCLDLRSDLSEDGSISKDLNLVPRPTDSFSEETSCLHVYSGNEDHGDSVRSSRKFEHFEEYENSFPAKGMLLTEKSWYTSPEEFTGAPSSYASDIYRLGVLLFELFCPFGSREEKSVTMSNLRHRVLPPQLLLTWPNEASFCLLLLHPDPSGRPNISVLLQSEFLNQVRQSLDKCAAEKDLIERIEEHELLLDFLSVMQQRKKETADKLQDTVSFLCTDIEEVRKLQSCPEMGNDHRESVLISDIIVDGDHDLSSALGSKKRSKPCLHHHSIEESVDNMDGVQESESHVGKHESFLSKSSRLMKNFKKLEAAYFSTRCFPNKHSGKHAIRQSPLRSDSGMITETSSVNNDKARSEWISPFLEGLCKYVAFSKLKVKAELKQGDLLNSSNLVCSLSFDRDGEFFASAGVNKKIKVFECDAILKEARDIHYPVAEMASRSKLSCICWNTYIKSQIASSNFEGVVQVWDVTRSQVLAELREHEKRAWSIDFSTADPTMLASGSDDGSVKLWNINQGASIDTIVTKANVCCVQFPPDSARMLAFGSADHKIYYYDLRNTRYPLCTLFGHNKTVSYVKFVDSVNLVSASTDNTLKLWDMSLCSSRVIDTPIQTFSGHTNVKNFVGLSVSDGYIATGSETNEVFLYNKAFPMPSLSHKFSTTELPSGRDTDSSSLFVSSVCWRGQSSTLVAANSTGDIQILEMA